MTSDDPVHDAGEAAEAGSSDGNDAWQIILNPASGDGSHVDEVRSRAAERGYTVRRTETSGDAVEFAKEAVADGARAIAACGGDGTVHQVVCGLDQADALDDVTFAVVPGGTGNNFARNVGVRSVEHAFELLETGGKRRIDLGTANGEPFTNSCIAGLTAQTSAETSSALKGRVGTLAYVISGMRQTVGFDPLDVEIDVRSGSNGGATIWEGEVLGVFIGNARRFTDGGGQADAEDGLLDVTIVEEMPTEAMLAEAAADQFFGRESDRVLRLEAEHLEIASRSEDDIEFSLDGEMSAYDRLSVGVRPHALEIVVGDDYEVEPAET